ncbi:1-acyl-sn-glycerol-3-phosphate acyltransferase [Sporobacter termitidis DSM 10068]|uniref:1-acyl-sn-glycerol-3-phosphate acyltransferase n=1 Tax=Sporobacter termitidis DSM 10068 TaxID=1123282 RepID=A0A1M5TIT4_9FIRM|nr:lysophospholipid acyltransferase family protein [Sporobacter termitidis]SHH50725.1 1-acyl-sn-glycerol-3-phosphate acyltransferase [Sporobacter termitidis DSM 10068]
MNKEYRAFRRLYHFLYVVLFPVYRVKCIGGENIPAGPAVFCANHSSNFDPILLCMGIGIEHHPHFMAKIELFRMPVLSSVIRAIGSFPVDRDRSDIGAIKTAMKYLKAGEKVGIFPEGRRNLTEDGDAKRGAVQIADQMSVPVIPVYIPRNKKPFHTYTIVVGAPYLVNPERKKLSRAEYDGLAGVLMDKIAALKAAGEAGQ